MKRLAAALIVLGAVCIGPLHAQEGPDYDRLTHCAAFSLFEAQLLAASDPGGRYQTEIARYNDQAAALGALAGQTRGKEPDAVFADIKARNQTMLGAVNDDQSVRRILEADYEGCNALGDQARMIIAQAR